MEERKLVDEAKTRVKGDGRRWETFTAGNQPVIEENSEVLTWV